MAENAQSKIAYTDKSVILSLLAEDQEFRQAFLKDPLEALDKYNLQLSCDLNLCLRNITTYVPNKPAASFNERLVLCSSAAS